MENNRKKFQEWKSVVFTKIKDRKTGTIAYRLNMPSHYEICQGCLGCLFTHKELERIFEDDPITHAPTIFLHGHSDIRDEDILAMASQQM